MPDNSAPVPMCLDTLSSACAAKPSDQNEEAIQAEGDEDISAPLLAQETPPIKRQLVLIYGDSGVGKTALASSLQDRIRRNKRGLYVSGKFDLYLQDAQPYFGIATACRELCGKILQLPTSLSRSKANFFQEIQETLVANLNAHDIQLLTNLIPELQEIVDYYDDDDDAHDCDGNVDETGKKTDAVTRDDNLHTITHTTIADNSAGPAAGNPQEAQEAPETQAKFHYVFRVFLRLITPYFAPLVIVLDDLQWADQASLELMQVIMTDRDNSNLMMVGLYRADEVERDDDDIAGQNERHGLTKTLSDLKEKSKDSESDFGIFQYDSMLRQCLVDYGCIARLKHRLKTLVVDLRQL